MSSEKDVDFEIPPVIAGMKISGENSYIDHLVKQGILIRWDGWSRSELSDVQPQPMFRHLPNLLLHCPIQIPEVLQSKVATDDEK